MADPVRQRISLFEKDLSKLSVLKKRLINPSKILKSVGAVFTKQAQRAFIDQALGDNKWKPRYPRQQEPFINIAGALSDFVDGRSKPKNRRFDRRPALVDTGILRRSVSNDSSISIKGQHVLEVGVTGIAQEYASFQQYGGTTTQDVTSQAQEGIADWIKELRGKRRDIAFFDRKKKAWVIGKGEPKKKGKSPEKDASIRGSKKTRTVKKKVNMGGVLKSHGEMKDKMERHMGRTKVDRLIRMNDMIARAQKLGFLTNKTRLSTEVFARPFLGFTTTSSKKAIEIIEEGLTIDVNSNR
jgi:phage gpG-like protein|tara:strand:- start:2072 stop:2965 length:894 start_codon:yes stop_codon:yes gene_type:complete